jgi:hypothetical protein
MLAGTTASTTTHRHGCKISLVSNAVVKTGGTRSDDKDDESFQARGRDFRPFLFAAILTSSTLLIIFNHAAAADI